MKIKVCGMTRASDAKLAAELGAWAVGFVFHPASPRYVTPQAAARIARELPAGIERVGVFVDATAGAIRAVAGEVGLTLAQLHGDETPELAASLGMRFVRAVRPRNVADLGVLSGFSKAELLLVDGYSSAARGGTGVPADRELAREAKRYGRLLLAGGLTPENVAGAIRDVQPDGVDVSSGVERAPGIKDEEKMRKFFEAARGAAAGGAR